MPDQLKIRETFVALLASSVLAGTALLICLNLKITQHYPDFIVGHTAWNATTKLQDFFAIPVFIVTFFLSYTLISYLFEQQKKLFGVNLSTGLSNQLAWWSIPALITVFTLISRGDTDCFLFYMSAAGISFICLTSSIYLIKNKEVHAVELSLTALAVILIALIPLEIFLACGRESLLFIETINPTILVKKSYLLAGYGLTLALLISLWKPHIISRFLPELLLIGQSGLSIFFLTLYPTRFLQPDNVLTEYDTGIGLKVLIATAIIAGLADVIRRYRNNLKNNNDLFSLLSPIVFCALVFAIKAGTTVLPHINPDDYHFGEGLIGAWLYLQGAIPFVDYIPPHGLIDDDFSGFISTIFFDGTTASISEAARLFYAILAFTAFIAIYLFSGSLGLAFVAILFLNGRFSWFFLTPILCLWFSAYLRARPSAWLSVWMLTVPVAILGTPPYGILLVSASAPMAAYYTWQLIKNPERRNYLSIGTSAGILILFAIFTPILPMLKGALIYLVENGAINQVAYGIPWSSSWNKSTKSGFVFEMIRMSWVVIPLIGLSIIHKIIKSSTAAKDNILPIIVIVIFLLLLTPYSMGRIDAGDVSRPGLATIFGWTILLPLAMWRLIKPGNRVFAISIIAAIGAGINYMPLTVSQFLPAINSQVAVSALRDGTASGFPNLGKIHINDEQWNRLNTLKKIFDEHLKPEESYLDLTSRNAQYFYLNRKPLIAVTAPFNMVSLAQQKRAVEKLSQNVPKIALLEASNLLHDGGGLALRNPYLFRFTIDNYVPAYEDGFIVGYSKAYYAEKTDTINATPKKTTDSNWNLGINRHEAAVWVDDPALISIIKIGDQIIFDENDIRTIQKINRNDGIIYIDGKPLNAGKSGYPNKFKLSANSDTISDYRNSLYQRSFSQSDLQKIPVAWGRSKNSLKSKMKLVNDIPDKPSHINDLANSDGSYTVTGKNPFMVFDIEKFNLSGHDAGLLKFNLSCKQKTSEPIIQIFWLGDHHTHISEPESIKFTGASGTMIIPLDASSFWLSQKKIHQLRIDLHNSLACKQINITKIGLFNRTFK